ncbi:MAG: hypothetical protein DRH21_03370, partial [Deltaproteobacteria bacterium]
ECIFEIPCPEFVVEPLEVEVWLEPNEQSSEIITLSNPGQLSVEWTAELEILTPGSNDWISIDPHTGVLTSGETTELIVYLDATDIFNSISNAIVNFSTSPNVSSPTVAIEMVIEGFPFIDGFNYEVSCTKVQLDWLVFPPGLSADSIYVYRDSVLIAITFENSYIDSLVFPEIEYTYYVTGFFINGNYNTSSLFLNTVVPLPDSLEPLNLENIAYYPDMYDITLWWDEPNTCIAPDGYNIYRDGDLIAEMVTELTFIDPDVTWMYELVGYNVTAVYYFGESEFSNTTYFLNSEIENFSFVNLLLFPNPVKDKLYIQLQPQYKINQIELLNNLGLTIFNNKVNSNSYQLDVSHLSPGIYFLKLETEQGFVLQKVLIQ